MNSLERILAVGNRNWLWKEDGSGRKVETCVRINKIELLGGCFEISIMNKREGRSILRICSA